MFESMPHGFLTISESKDGLTIKEYLNKIKYLRRKR